ncbi:hypothetical protein FVEG_03426 [Fusarium verticillioides 7600]|uniref:Uncharacterized protein n=1 Tax=Gibberella moniliformis (strain M3125 / FGSC 7600) TaxID=334819 RepID=W7M8L4_GIBM7|nr:hypothetical protein FVEG_03426 [Fusarium verticillioides 7600]EWG41287.1 hypothetical protein FVEG_03426 [Fusarium verticillioides 7600]
MSAYDNDRNKLPKKDILVKTDTYENHTMKRITVWRWPAYTINWLKPEWDGQFCVPEGESPVELRSDPPGLRPDTPPVGHCARPSIRRWGDGGPGGDSPSPPLPPPPPPPSPPSLSPPPASLYPTIRPQTPFNLPPNTPYRHR